MKYRFFCLFIIGVLLFTVDGLGQNIFKDDITLSFFKKGKKKPVHIPKVTLDNNSYYEVFKDKKGYEYDLIDKIEIKVKELQNINILVLRLQDYVVEKPVDTIYNQMVEITPNNTKEVFIGSSIGGLSDSYNIIIKSGDTIIKELSYWIR